MGEPLRIGMVGCGAIARQYLETSARLEAIAITAVADAHPDRAAAVESAYGPARCRRPPCSPTPRWISSST